MDINKAEKGTKVKFKKGLKVGIYSSTNLTLWEGRMYDVVKEDPIMTVSLITEMGNFEVEENAFAWSPDWLDVVETIEKGDIVEFDDTVLFHNLRGWSGYTTEEMLSIILNEHRTRPRFTVKSANKYGFKVEENEWEWNPDWFFIVEKASEEKKMETRECNRTERIILNGLVSEGFSFVARDEDGTLFAYRARPYKDGNMWVSYRCHPEYEFEDIENDSVFQFIAWEDKDPRSIKELLDYEELPW